MKESHIIIIFLFCFGFSSCSEDKNPVDPDPSFSFDIAHYEWSFDTLEGFYVDQLIVLDTNSIFLTNRDNLIYYDGIEYKYHYRNDGNFTGGVITGISSTNIYLAGGTWDVIGVSTNLSIKKWNGGSFEFIELPENNFGHDGFQTSLTISENEYWFGTLHGRILKYDGHSNFEFFSPVDTTYSIKGISFINNAIHAVAVRESGIGTSQEKIFIKILKYNNDKNWETVFTKTYDYQSAFIYPEINSDIIYGIQQEHDLYMFNQTDYTKILHQDNLIIWNASKIAGSLESSNFSIGSYNILYNWNGKNWSIEFGNANQHLRINQLKLFNSQYYCLFSDVILSMEFYVLAKGKSKEY